MLWLHLKRLQIPMIDPQDHLGNHKLKRGLEFFLMMHLKEHIEADGRAQDQRDFKASRSKQRAMSRSAHQRQANETHTPARGRR